MKPTTTDWSKQLVVATGEDGLLYSPRMREALSARVAADKLPAVETFAAIGLAARQLRARMDRWCEKEGLSETRLGILFMLRHASAGAPAGALVGVPLGALAGRLRVSPRNVTGLIDHLERDGLVTRTPDPADRRSVLAQLTERGRERIDAMSGEMFRQQQDPLAGFTRDELVMLRHLCLKLVGNMDEAKDLPE